MAEQYIYTIESLTKAYGKREVLKNIWLAFYPGAKIGVIGSNGSGKSSLLRVMAGLDQDHLGTSRPADFGHCTVEVSCRRSRAWTKRRTSAVTWRRRSRRSARLLQLERGDRRPSS